MNSCGDSATMNSYGETSTIDSCGDISAVDSFGDSSTIDSCCVRLVNCEYSVWYSEAYCVPVLYCRMWDGSGTLLGLEEIWQFAPPAARGWSQLTIVAHPVTDTPWIQVHPCKTAAVMGEMASVACSTNSANYNYSYIVTFLSVYGQAVGLHLTYRYVDKIHSDVVINDD